jgi:antitoxin PrlF
VLHTAKVTAKFQTTVPASVRKALHLQVGDFIGFEVVGNEVKLRRATPIDLAFNQALEGTLSEWNSDQDERAFKGL